MLYVKCYMLIGLEGNGSFIEGLFLVFQSCKVTKNSTSTNNESK